jgi:hypothetical protein
VSIGLVLDTSALLAHVRLERVSAGELIGEVADNGELTGIPALAVLDVLPALDGDDRKRMETLLTGDSLTVAVLPLTGDDVLGVEQISALIAGARGDAQAVLEANRRGVLLATTEPGRIGVGVVIHRDDVAELS